MAFAYHSALDFAVKQDLSALQWKPTLVICHRGYETSLNQFTMADMHAKFEAMHTFRSGQRRRLVFVDESLELIYLARLTADGIETAQARIPYRVRRAHRRAWHVLDSVYDSILATPSGQYTALTPADLLARADAT